MTEAIGLLTWILILRRRLYFFAAVSFFSGALTLIVVLLMPRWYQARASILPPHQDSREWKSSTEIGQALQLDIFRPYTEGVTLGDVYLAILGSDAVARAVIDRFDLRGRYENSTMVKTMQALRSHTVIAPTDDHTIEVRAEDKDPRFAADLANAFVEELNLIVVQNRVTAGKRQRMFLETRVAKSKAELDSMEASLSDLQERRGFTSLSRDMTEAALASGSLLGRKLALSIRLGVLDELGAESTPARQELATELRALDAEIAKLPLLGVETARRLRDLRMTEFLYLELLNQLEIARIEEARDTPAVDVLDRAVPPDRHVRPRRGLTAIAGALVGLGLAVAWTVAKGSPA